MVTLKTSWSNKFVLRLLTIGLTVGLALSIGVNYYNSGTISSLNQTIANQNLVIDSKNSVISSQNSTITNLMNESSVQAYEALKVQLASVEASLQNATVRLTNAQGQITNLQLQLTEANDNVTSLRAQLTKSNADVASLKSQLSSANDTITGLRGQIDTLKQQVSSYQAQITTLTTQNDRLQRILNTYWVQVSGGASSKSGGTTASWVYFYSNGVRYGSPVTSNIYSFNIPNNSTYEIFIQWNSPINEGVCDTGQNFTAQGAQTSYQVANASC